MEQASTARTRPPLHVVQVSWDASIMQLDAPSDAAERQELYARLLEVKRPGSRMTMVVLGAEAEMRRTGRDGLIIETVAGRWAGVLRLPRVLRRLDAERPISVIAPQSPLEDGWASLAFSRGRVPVVAQVHFDILSDAALPGGSKARRWLGRMRRRTALCLLPSYAAVRTVAPDMSARLLALGARWTRPIPVPVLDLNALLQLEPRDHQCNVLFVGRLAPEKNLELWLAVAQRVVAVMPDAQFNIIGDGALRPALEARTRQLGLDASVTFHGATPRADLPNVYARASVLLLTSDHEGFGRVLVEAMAAGVAVVSTQTAGAQEVLGAGEVGILAPVGDAEALATGVLRLLRDTPYRAGLVAMGRRHVTERYGPLMLAGQWVDMLIEAAEQRIARPSR